MGTEVGCMYVAPMYDGGYCCCVGIICAEKEGAVAE